MISINSVTMPTPSTCQVGTYDIVKADRNANGLMIIERIATKRKLELSWNYISQTNLATLLTAINTSVFFSVTYPDPQLNANNTITCYCGDRTAGMITYKDGVPLWKDIKFSLIEQ